MSGPRYVIMILLIIINLLAVHIYAVCVVCVSIYVIIDGREHVLYAYVILFLN